MMTRKCSTCGKNAFFTHALMTHRQELVRYVYYCSNCTKDFQIESNVLFAEANPPTEKRYPTLTVEEAKQFIIDNPPSEKPAEEPTPKLAERVSAVTGDFFQFAELDSHVRRYGSTASKEIWEEIKQRLGGEKDKLAAARREGIELGRSGSRKMIKELEECLAEYRKYYFDEPPKGATP
jgi:hypothetical protein